MNIAIEEHFRCPKGYFDFAPRGPLSEQAQFFSFGAGNTCYGRRWVGAPNGQQNAKAYDAATDVQVQGTKCFLPFDPTEVAHNLRRERYPVPGSHRGVSAEVVRRAYYALRPLLPVHIRKHLQRRALRGWKSGSTFPSWPVDRSVDAMFEKLLLLSLKLHNSESVPFIWFWPEGKQGCIVMTHDVETAAGLRSCDDLAALDNVFGVKSSFQLIPGARYTVTPEILDSLRSRGFEVNIHDLTHDGSLFQNPKEFVESAARINQYAAQWKTRGFRSGSLYRNPEWYDCFDLDYDMSIPNVGRLDPQRGGCCTLMPYFIGKILEIPVTTTQDYSLFHIMNEYSIAPWIHQLEHILKGNGLASFIIHPDYVAGGRSLLTYTHLLEHLQKVRSESNAWMALPGEVNQWWRERNKMSLVRKDQNWEIEGPGQERARIAYAHVKNGELAYSVCPLVMAAAS
jgi:hypothetical protein